MKVIISAGGSGGHIYPALAIINKIKEKEPNSEFLYIGTHNRMEKDIIPNYGIPFETITIYGLNRKNIFKNFKVLGAFLESYYKCKRLIKKFNPDIVIGVGGYVTGPVVFAAHKLGYKTLIHEQNSIPGKCNTFLSNFVSAIAISLPGSKKYFPEYKTIFTGNPCSEAAVKAPLLPKKELGLSENKKLVLFAFGSLGSEKMNEIILKAMTSLAKKDYEILFITGKDSYEEIAKNKFPSNVKVVPFIENTPRIMKSVDVFVSRAGASFLSEVIALELPTILIPSPYVPENHQYINALELVNAEAATMIEEKNLTSDILVNTIDNLVVDEELRKTYRTNLKKLSVSASATKIYQLIKEIINGEHL